MTIPRVVKKETTQSTKSGYTFDIEFPVFPVKLFFSIGTSRVSCDKIFNEGSAKELELDTTATGGKPRSQGLSSFCPPVPSSRGNKVNGQAWPVDNLKYVPYHFKGEHPMADLWLLTSICIYYLLSRFSYVLLSWSLWSLRLSNLSFLFPSTSRFLS